MRHQNPKKMECSNVVQSFALFRTRNFLVLNKVGQIFLFSTYLFVKSQIFQFCSEVHELDLVNYLVHGANSVIMVVDFLMVGHPFRLAHSVYPLALIFIYTIFNYLYYQFGGTDRYLLFLFFSTY